MSQKFITHTFKTGFVQLGFPTLKEPKATVPGTPEKYSALIIFPSDSEDPVKIQNVVKQIIDEDFGGVEPKGFRHPLRDKADCVNDAGNRWRGCGGDGYVMTAKSKDPFGLVKVDPVTRKVVPASAEEFTAGAICKFEVNLKAYNVTGTKGVAVYGTSILLVDPTQKFEGSETDWGDDPAEGYDIPVVDEPIIKE